MLTIRDVIMKTQFEKVSQIILFHYEANDLAEVHKVYKELKNSVPKTNTSNMKIFIRVLKENEDGFDEVIDNYDVNDRNLMFDICGEDDEYDGLYSISSSEYSELLGYYVEDETTKRFSCEEIVAHLLWELEWR